MFMALLEVNFGLTFFTWVVFLLVLIPGYFGWSEVLEVLEQRQEKIQEDITVAEEERENAEQLRRERQEALNEAHDEAREIVENGREKGEEERERIIKEARDEAESMIDDAEREIDLQRKRAFEEVEGEIGELALNLAEKLLRQKLDEEDHRRIVDEFIDRVDKEQPVG